MQQVIYKTKINLINHTNDINFPSYYENQNSPLLTNLNIIDISSNYNIQNGSTSLSNETPIVFNNILFVCLLSQSNFYYIIGNNAPIQSSVFCYNNLTANPIDQIEIYNGNLVWDGYYFNTIPNLQPITINYFLITN